MSAPSKQDWVIAELLLNPQRLFILWAVKTRFCTQSVDFQRHFGADLPIDELITDLEQNGFLRQNRAQLVLTDMGERAVSNLRDIEVSPYAIANKDEVVNMHKRVFVSSTFTDLAEFRRVVREAIRQLGAIDISMENFGACDERPKDECIRLVNESDIFVGIYAYRYGNIPEDEDISITEIEYDTATLAGIPRLIYLIDENAPWIPSNIERGTGEAKLKRFKDKLKANHLCGFFSTKYQLSTKVAADLGRYFSSGRDKADLEERFRLDEERRIRTQRRNLRERVRAEIRKVPGDILDDSFRSKLHDLISDLSHVAELEKYLKYTAEAVRKNSKEIALNGLLLLECKVHVKDVILEVHHRQDQTIAGCELHFEVAKDTRESITNAKRAAFQLLDYLAPASGKHSIKDMPYCDDNYGVSVYLEDYPGGIPGKGDEIPVVDGVEDESLGLAIALGVIHRFLGYDCQERAFAAIGKIIENGERTYSLGSIEGIHAHDKVYAACIRRIPRIIVPTANEPEASRAKEEAVQQGRIEEDQVEIFGVNSLLEAALYAFELNLILFHCNHILAREQTKLKNFYLKELEDLRGPRMIIHPYFNNQLYNSEMEESNNEPWKHIKSEEVAKWVAAEYSERWLNADLEERETIPSPVILNTHGGNDPIEAIKSVLQGSCSVDLANRLNIPADRFESHVLSHSQLYLDKGRFAIFVRGFNPYEIRANLDNLVNGGDMLLSLFAGDGILSELLESPRRRNVVLVCCETMRTWFRSDPRVRSLARHFTNDRIHKCYRGVSTAFDKYVSKVAADYMRIITCRWPPSIGTYRCVIERDPDSHIQFVPPHVFFYGRGAVKKLFIDTYISEIRGADRQPNTLYRLLKERTVKRFLILGDGNTGKSTLLLKTLHDCKRGCLPYVPVLARLRGRLASTEHLYELMADECGFEEINEFKFALKYTRDLLVMLDGLNESEMELEHLTSFTNKYEGRLPEDNGEHSAIILTSRTIPKGLEAEEELRFIPYRIEAVTTEQAADMLKYLFPARAENILTALTGPSGDREILANPFMFILLCGIVNRLPQLSGLASLTRTEMRQKMVEDWLDREGERQRHMGEERDLLEGTQISLSQQVETCIRGRRLTRRENYLCHLAFEMVTDGNKVHISYGDGVACIQKIIKELDKPAVDPQANRFYAGVAGDLFKKLVSGSLLSISPSSDVSFEHESIRDFMAAERLAVMLTNGEETADDNLNSFVSKVPKYSDLLSFTCGCLEPGKAKQIVAKLLEKGDRLVGEVNRLLDEAGGLPEGSERNELEEEAIERIDDRKDFLECAVECCVENRELEPEVIDALGVKLTEQIVYTDALTDRRDLGNLLARLGRSHHNSKAFEKTLCILQKLAHTFQKPTLPNDICPERKSRDFFFSQTIVEILGFLGFPEDGVIKALTGYFRAPVGNLGQKIHEKYPWRALEAFADLEWNCNVLKKLLEWIDKEHNPEIAAFGWHAVGALGHPSAVSMLQEKLEPDFQKEISAFLSEAPLSVKGFAKDLEGNTDLREVLLEFVRSQNREERWCPVFLALLSGLELDEILSNVVDKRVENLLKYRWRAAEVIVRSKRLESKFYPLERCLRDYKNYFFAEWAERQASSLESSARDSDSPNEIIKESLEKILSVDRKLVKERLGDIDSLAKDQIRHKIKSCIDEGQRRDTGDRGFTWSSLVILGVPFKMVTSYDQLREMFIEAERELWEQEEMRRKDSRVAPLDTYPRDILKKLMDEKKLEEKYRGRKKVGGIMENALDNRTCDCFH